MCVVCVCLFVCVCVCVCVCVDCLLFVLNSRAQLFNQSWILLLLSVWVGWGGIVLESALVVVVVVVVGQRMELGYI